MESNVERIFDGKKPAKLGTEARPAKISVQTEARRAEIEAICDKSGWKHEITVDASKPENTFDLDQLQNPVVQAVAAPKIGRNEPCPCGSGKKYKKCCGK